MVQTVDLTTANSGVKTDATRESAEARKQRAAEVYRSSPSSTPAALADSLAGDVFSLMVEDFAAIYKSARGYTIDPIYIRALRADCLCVLAALDEASRLTSPQPDSQASGTNQ